MVDRLVNSEANARRIAMVESCFGTSGHPLNEPGRVLVGEGLLTKMCRKKPKPRQFFLFNDILVYGNSVISKKKYNKQHIIPLEEVQLSSLEDDGPEFRNGWLIKTPTKSFAVYAATATEKAEWMAHINKCVTDLLRKSGKKAAENHAAVWVPDSETQVCMHCKKTQFTLLNRRHHCRKCGKVVCGPCSSKKVMLVHQSSKPLRVCLSCHDELSSSQTGNPTSLPTNLKPDPVSEGDDDDDDEGMKEQRTNDSSGDDDSDDDLDDPSVQPAQNATETMTFYEGGDLASNGGYGEAPSQLDASTTSTITLDTTVSPNTSMDDSTTAASDPVN